MPRHSKARDDDPQKVQLCFALTAVEFGVPDLTPDQPAKRGPLRDLARQVAMRLAHTSFGMTHARVGALSGRHPSTVAHGCLVVEEECDDPTFAARLERLEQQVRSIVGVSP